MLDVSPEFPFACQTFQPEFSASVSLTLLSRLLYLRYQAT